LYATKFSPSRISGYQGFGRYLFPALISRKLGNAVIIGDNVPEVVPDKPTSDSFGDQPRYARLEILYRNNG
jgi:hypothetical protein